MTTDGTMSEKDCEATRQYQPHQTGGGVTLHCRRKEHGPEDHRATLLGHLFEWSDPTGLTPRNVGHLIVMK